MNKEAFDLLMSILADLNNRISLLEMDNEGGGYEASARCKRDIGDLQCQIHAQLSLAGGKA